MLISLYGDWSSDVCSSDLLVEKVLGEDAIAIDTLTGEQLTEITYDGPVFELTDRQPAPSPIITGDFVTTEDGTGLVHIAPAFGEDDYSVAAAHGIFDPTQQDTLYNPVGLDGNYTDQVVGFEERFVKDPELTEELIASLESRGLLFRSFKYEHSYPHCWRCSTPLIYYAKGSWYIKTTSIRQGMLDGNEGISWYPPHIKEGRSSLANSQ